PRAVAPRRPRPRDPLPSLCERLRNSTPIARRTGEAEEALLQARIQELVYQLGVALALQLGHHLAHQRVALLLAVLVVRGRAVLLDGGRLAREHCVDDCPELTGVAHLREPALPDNRVGPLLLFHR